MAQEIGAMEAAMEGIKAVAPGLSLSKILSEVGSELGRMGGAGEAFAVGMQFIAQVTQQASNGFGTNRIALLLQLLG